MKSRTKNSPSRKRTRFNRRWLVVALLLLIVVVVALALTGNNKPATNNTAASNSSNYNGEKQQSTGSASGSNSKTDSAGVASGQAPREPYGNFVSSHSVGFNDTESSTCLTSAGAVCQITFSKDGVSKSLNQETADASGAAYWTWKPQDLGLTAGSWQIKATASLNNQNSSATDSRNLVVGQ